MYKISDSQIITNLYRVALKLVLALVRARVPKCGPLADLYNQVTG